MSAFTPSLQPEPLPVLHPFRMAAASDKKSGEKCLVPNYRPISLLCVSSKVLEKIVFDHILHFVNEKISPHQFGFMHHRSTLQQLLILLNSIFEASSSSSQTDLIYLDFKKAFDSVAHNIQALVLQVTPGSGCSHTCLTKINVSQSTPLNHYLSL